MKHAEDICDAVYEYLTGKISRLQEWQDRYRADIDVLNAKLAALAEAVRGEPEAEGGRAEILPAVLAVLARLRREADALRREADEAEPWLNGCVVGPAESRAESQEPRAGSALDTPPSAPGYAAAVAEARRIAGEDTPG